MPAYPFVTRGGEILVLYHPNPLGLMQQGRFEELEGAVVHVLSAAGIINPWPGRAMDAVSLQKERLNTMALTEHELATLGRCRRNIAIVGTATCPIGG